jgi:hypothetical protein
MRNWRRLYLVVTLLAAAFLLESLLPIDIL